MTLAHRSVAGLVHRQRWRIDAAGLRVEHRFDVPEELDDLPRLGVAMALAPELDRLQWMGRGPIESYSDRLRGARLGLHTCRVHEQSCPYVVPQEYGLHGEVSWLSLCDDEGRGLRIRGDRPLLFSALAVRPNDLYAARRGERLRLRDEVWLSLDRFHRGVGTGACGPEVLPAYRVPTGRQWMRFAIEPVRRGLR